MDFALIFRAIALRLRMLRDVEVAAVLLVAPETQLEGLSLEEWPAEHSAKKDVKVT